MRYLFREFLLFVLWLPREVSFILTGVAFYYLMGWQYAVSYGIGTLTFLIVDICVQSFRMQLIYGTLLSVLICLLFILFRWI